VIDPLLHKYVYGEVPPVDTTFIEPVGVPKHVALDILLLLTVKGAGGSETVIEVEFSVHPLISVTVTE
jgi:hypothetical protein